MWYVVECAAFDMAVTTHLFQRVHSITDYVEKLGCLSTKEIEKHLTSGHPVIAIIANCEI